MHTTHSAPVCGAWRAKGDSSIKQTLTLATTPHPLTHTYTRTHVQVTYSTVDCAVVGTATISNACAALTAKTVAEYPDLTVTGCTGECGSLVLRLQIDDSVRDADIAAVETAVAANPALIAIAIMTTDGGTVGLAPSTFVFQAATPAAVNAANAAQPATGKKGKGNKKAKKAKKGKNGSSKVGKVAKDAAAKGKGKKGKKTAKLTLQTADGAERSLAASTSQTQGLFLFALIGAAMVAVGATRHTRARAAALLRGAAADSGHFADPSEKSPLVARGTTQRYYS